jgi:hypothetical protein
MAEGGISAAYVNNAIGALRSELMGEIRSLRSWAASEIKRLEEEMREVGVMIVRAIDTQTVAVVGGVTANTLMLEGLKVKVEEEFGKTIEKLDAQIESALQIEYIKKAAEASSVKSKLDAFVKDIRARFDKSIFISASNRELYNTNFKKITEEYESKIYTIGEHIFKIRDEDIAPALAAARVPYDLAHGLSIEMDLTRLTVRSENLDQIVGLLRTSRVNDALSSLDDIERDLAGFDTQSLPPAQNIQLCVEAVTAHSATASSLFGGMQAQPVSGNQAISLVHIGDLDSYSSVEGRNNVVGAIGRSKQRPASENEIKAITKAAADLVARKLISADAKEQMTDFLSAGKLKMLEV